MKIIYSILMTFISLTILFFTSCKVEKTITHDETAYRDEKVPYDAEEDVRIKSVAVFQLTSPDVNNFTFSNDDLNIYYDFHGKESTTGQLKFKIENITNKNIFIDLAYSSFINNGRANNYTEAVDVKGKVLLIPDKSYLDLPNFEGITNANKSYIETLIQETVDKGEKLFSKDNSPLKFRNKIIYDYQETISNSPQVIDNNFYVNKLNVYPVEAYNLLPEKEVKNSLIFHYNYQGKQKVTKYRTESKPYKHSVSEQRRVFSPQRTAILVGSIILVAVLPRLGNKNK